MLEGYKKRVHLLNIKRGFFNDRVSDAEVHDALAAQFPQLRFVNKSKRKQLKIETRSGIARIEILRSSRGAFYVAKEIPLRYYLITFGFAEAFEGLAGGRQQIEIREFLRERFHIEPPSNG